MALVDLIRAMARANAARDVAAVRAERASSTDEISGSGEPVDIR
ncbi:hypothetical protein SPAN111604_05290 [Sphingomonas antarctica]